MRILIAGCGYVGCVLARMLANDGHAVWGLRRASAPLPEGVKSIVADLTNPGALASLPPNLDAVVYAATAGGFDEARYRAAYVDGPRTLVAALETQRQRPRRAFFISSTGVYAQDSGEWIDETSPTTPAHFSGTTLIEGERTVFGGPFPATVVRFAGIYGPGRTRLIDSIRAGAALPPSPSYVNHVHRDDCAGILRHLLFMDKPEDLYLGVDCEPVERGELMRWLADQLGVPAPGVADADEPPSVRAQRSNKRCSNARLLATGYTFRYPTYREGYKALVRSAA
jgi:nucleoside-diphosphate-sugar epimerase